MVLIPYLRCRRRRLQLLDAPRLWPNIDQDRCARIENVTVARVHRLHGRIDLPDAHMFAALHLEQATSAGRVRLHRLEATVNAALSVPNAALEVAQKHVRFMVLHLTMLTRLSVEMIVQLDGQIGSGAGLVLRRFGAQPKVNVPRELAFDFFGLWASASIRNTSVFIISHVKIENVYLHSAQCTNRR